MCTYTVRISIHYNNNVQLAQTQLHGVIDLRRHKGLYYYVAQMRFTPKEYNKDIEVIY